MATDIHLTLLERVRVASPCTVRWEDMTGDEITRHCAQCDLKVHNISAMTRPQAEAFLATQFEESGEARSGRVCAQIWRRHDGTVITRDCPVGLERVRAAAKRAAVRIAAAVGLITGVSAVLAWTQRDDQTAALGGRLRGLEPIATLSRWMAPRSLPPLPGRPQVPIAGGICCLPPPPPPPPPPPSAPNPAQPGGIARMEGH